MFPFDEVIAPVPSDPAAMTDDIAWKNVSRKKTCAAITFPLPFFGVNLPRYSPKQRININYDWIFFFTHFNSHLPNLI